MRLGGQDLPEIPLPRDLPCGGQQILERGARLPLETDPERGQNVGLFIRQAIVAIDLRQGRGGLLDQLAIGPQLSPQTLFFPVVAHEPFIPERFIIGRWSQR